MQRRWGEWQMKGKTKTEHEAHDTIYDTEYDECVLRVLNQQSKLQCAVERGVCASERESTTEETVSSNAGGSWKRL